MSTSIEGSMILKHLRYKKYPSPRNNYRTRNNLLLALVVKVDAHLPQQIAITNPEDSRGAYNV